MMRRAVVVGFLLVFGLAVRGSSVYRYEVDRGSDLEKELGYELSVHEEHGEKQTESVDKVIPVEGAAPNYTVKFHVPAADKLKDVFELALTVNDGNAILAQVPLAISSRFTKENEVDVQFLIRKDWIDQAVLDIRRAPWMTVRPETVYSIRSEITRRTPRRQRRSESPNSARGTRASGRSLRTALTRRQIIRITSAL